MSIAIGSDQPVALIGAAIGGRTAECDRNQDACLRIEPRFHHPQGVRSAIGSAGLATGVATGVAGSEAPPTAGL